MLGSTASAQSDGWSLLPDAPPAGNRFDDGYFVSPDSGFVITGRRDAYSTSDGGQSWDFLGVFPVGPRSMGFATSQIGWVGTLFGPDQILYETRNGGRTFTNITDRIQGDVIRGHPMVDPSP